MSQKVKTCPECGSTDLGDSWQAKRRLKQFCHEEDCFWEGPLRVPELLKVSGKKEVYLNAFTGHTYEIYDRYGHIMTLSQTYATSEMAIQEMKNELVKGETDVAAGPYTGVLFKIPLSVMITGKMFKVKRGKVRPIARRK